MLVMKAYFVIGRWMVNPKATKIELDAVRADIQHYVQSSHSDVISIFMRLLVFLSQVDA